ncbi:MAG: hypothetical protein ACI4Q4_02485 [Oscillospiraceae bacterium]
MAITGTGAIEREQSILFIQINGIWYPIGEDNESLERTRNNTVTQTKNVLGATKSKVTKGNQVTSVSPYLVARDSALGKELYEIDRLDKQLDEVKYRFMEVSIFDKVGEEQFAAWTQEAKIDLKSWGGAAADGVTAPFDIVWEGERTYGVYDRSANTFTSEDGIGALTVVSTAGTTATSTVLFVSPQLETGNHYVYKGGASAQNVTEGQDVSSWTNLSPGTAVSVSGSPAIITVVEADAANKAVKAGSATAVYGSST